ncbi:MAG: methionine adenosyltransferase [Chloroflexota bacterium]|jgi:S-adenosylmethionine synthetase
MSTTFMKSPSLLFTSESVTEGHPDKLCDQVSDAILDAFLTVDPRARVACETATTTGLIAVMGEVTVNGNVGDIQDIVRKTVKEIGYTGGKFYFDAESCGVVVSLHGQSPDIAMGVNQSLESKNGEMSDAEVEAIGAGDQGMMIGFACNETPELMPLTISLSHRLTRELAVARKSGKLPFLGPDGKSQVTVEYEYGKPKRINTVVLSTQHTAEISQGELRAQIQEHILNKVLPANMLDNPTIHINPTGQFIVGGPHGDAGLTGRKIIVDTYGGVARHGGGAFSGKDPTKVDRSAAYAARYVAKNVVAAGLADRFEVQLSYAIGVARPVSISIESYGTAKIDETKLAKLIDEMFDLRPGAIIRDLKLRRPIYRQTAAYGHFGRTDIDLPWEATDKADALRRAAGL